MAEKTTFEAGEDVRGNWVVWAIYSDGKRGIAQSNLRTHQKAIDAAKRLNSMEASNPGIFASMRKMVGIMGGEQ